MNDFRFLFRQGEETYLVVGKPTSLTINQMGATSDVMVAEIPISDYSITEVSITKPIAVTQSVEFSVRDFSEIPAVVGLFTSLKNKELSIVQDANGYNVSVMWESTHGGL